MKDLQNYSPHSFHIPVMGTGFTIDSPLRVAKYGISSVISLVDDILIEQMRKYHSEKAGEPYEEIPDSDIDARAHRITAYLNLLDRIVKKQVDELRKSSFEKGSELTRYYEFLPESALKQSYMDMIETRDPIEKTHMQDDLRKRVVTGSIDVNIMTKLDCDKFVKGVKLPPEYSDAKSALRGFALSTLNSSVVCSAGMNREFYKYFSSFNDFYPDNSGSLYKKIILKVSDYRSAEIQGKFLAKLGLWVSEFRIESGLNCGGHAFATKGKLLGPILEEFKEKRTELSEELHIYYNQALRKLGRPEILNPIYTRITVQGGIGTAAENDIMLNYYKADGTGWGTPFMLVPEAVNVDELHLAKLLSAAEEDVYLSDSSPLGIPFWNLRNSGSEEKRLKSIKEGRPGRPCNKGYLKFNTEFTDLPICQASTAYQKRKLEMLDQENLTPEQYDEKREYILGKSCICHDLGGSAKIKYGIDTDATPAICCGPNIVYFSKIASLNEMIDHIYGRISLPVDKERPNLFVKELMIYVEYLKKEIDKNTYNVSESLSKYLSEFKGNLLEGISYYLDFAEKNLVEQKERFIREMNALKAELESIPLTVSV